MEPYASRRVSGVARGEPAEENTRRIEETVPKETYLEIIRYGEQRSGINMLTPEYEVTSILFDLDRITPLDMLGHFSGSNAAFFKILKALEVKDVLSSETNPSDRRSKFYRLSDSALAIMAGQWSRYKEGKPEDLYASDNPDAAIRSYTKTVTQTLKVKQFTCEYQILLYLSASPGMTNIRFHNLVDVSEAKFNMCLAELKKSGHIYYEHDPSDRRKKLYFLSDREVKLFKDMEKRIFHWLDARSHLFAAPK